MKKLLLVFAFVAAALCAAQRATAQSDPNDVLTKQETACESNITYLRGRDDEIVLWSNVFMIVGAAISGIGAALAGFLAKEGQRKSAAVVGAIGAVLTVLPKALPDKSDVEAKLSAADKHHTVGAKFRNQFAFARPNESLTEAEKYVSARFTDCAALSPPASVPDFPTPAPEASLPKFATVAPLPGAGPSGSPWGPDAGPHVVLSQSQFEPAHAFPPVPPRFLPTKK